MDEREMEEEEKNREGKTFFFWIAVLRLKKNVIRNPK
jgi:hypothetical protein